MGTSTLAHGLERWSDCHLVVAQGRQSDYPHVGDEGRETGCKDGGGAVSCLGIGEEGKLGDAVRHGVSGNTVSFGSEARQNGNHGLVRAEKATAISGAFFREVASENER